MKRFLSIVIVFAIVTVGCAPDGSNNSRNSTSEELGAFPVVVDGVTIEESPEHIISLSPALTEILFEFGEGKRLIGRSAYCDFPAGVKSAEVIPGGSGFEPESIIGLEPDLLLMPYSISEKDKVALEREGIATVIIPAPKTLEEFQNVYRIMGLLLYGVFTGAENGDSTFADIDSACSNPDEIDFGDFVYVTEGMFIATGDTLESSILSRFGKNIASESEGYSFDKSTLLEEQPDFILLNDRFSIEWLSSDEIFSQLEAVINGRVIMLDNARFERPSKRITTQIESLQMQYNKLRSL